MSEKRKHDAVDSDSDDEYGPRPATMPAVAQVAELSPEEKAKQALQAKREAQLAKLKALIAAHEQRLPNAQMYEKSYMHRTPLTFTLYAHKTDFLITASEDGVVKLWKKTPTDIDFVKAFKAHAGPVIDGAVDSQGAFLATIGTDNTVKIFSIEAFDLTSSIELSFTPTAVAWLPIRAQEGVLALGDTDGSIHLMTTSGTPLAHRQIHDVRVHIIRTHPAQPFALSVDAKGHVEAWGSSAEGISEYFDDPHARGFLAYSSKLTTGLAELLRLKARVLDLQFTPDGSHYLVHMVAERAAASALWKIPSTSDTGLTTATAIAMFRTKSGQLIRRLIEDADTYTAAHGSRTLADGSANPHPLDAVELGKRLAREREVEKMTLQNWSRGYGYPAHTLALDTSGHFAFAACAMGIRVWNLSNGRPVNLLGFVEAEERFTSITVFQGVPKATGTAAGSTVSARVLLAGGAAAAEESALFTCAHKRPRVYAFTQREPADEHRDVLNERIGAKPVAKAASTSLRSAKHVTLHTTLGDIRVELFPEAAPKTVHNFVSLCEKQYYNACVIHRVIKGFMIQTGDAENGNGTGGQSIFGRPFEDEISDLKHDRPGVLSMANAGPNTNGSQFFITTVPTPHLDRKHTVFGRVVAGMDSVKAIEAVKTNPKNDRPLDPIKILNTTVE